MDHPYEVDDFDGTTTVKVTAGGFYSIVNGWGNTGTEMKCFRLLLHDPDGQTGGAMQNLAGDVAKYELFYH